jgi:hypothetical protein
MESRKSLGVREVNHPRMSMLRERSSRKLMLIERIAVWIVGLGRRTHGPADATRASAAAQVLERLKSAFPKPGTTSCRSLPVLVVAPE